MSFNTFGKIFRFTTWGESHGPAIGCVIDGCPPNIPISEKDIQIDMDRRRPGQSKFTTQRKEADQVTILSGVFEGKTTGVENWFTSDWFGTFQRANENWIFHANFGWWLYLSNEAGFGQWFWNEKLGWCWTSKSTYPFLWHHQVGNWFYWMARKNDKNLFWNYASSNYELL